MLEIGCGTGNTLRVIRETIPQATLVGMDAYHAGLLHAKNRTNASIVEGRIEHMPFRKRFSLVGMFDVLEHIEDEVAALAAVHASLETGGRFIVTVPANPSLWSRFDDESHHQRRYTESHLRAVLSGARFEVEYVTHFMCVTYPAIVGVPTPGALAPGDVPWHAATSRPSAASCEFRASSTPCFSQLLRLELPFIKRRYRLPMGTSLLAIARS